MRAVGLQVAADKLAVAEASLGSLTYSAYSKDVFPPYSQEVLLPTPGFRGGPLGVYMAASRDLAFPGNPKTWLFPEK